MSERVPGPYDSIARKWLALAERRQAAFIEMLDSGRWKHYFSEAELHNEMHRIAIIRERWAELAGLSDEQDAVAPSERRSAA